MSAHTENTVWVNAPMDHVWTKTNDVADWPNLFSEYADAEVLEQAENTIKFRLTMHPDENGKQWSWVSERRMDPQARTVHAQRIEMGPFEYMNIYWEYVEEDGGVRMNWKQDFQMKPTAPVNDEQMATRINTNTPIQMNLIKEKLEAALAR